MRAAHRLHPVGTLANLRAVGYDVTDANVYLKDANATTEPWLSGCAPSCSTTQYKSLTRERIESLGYDIVANFGDQFSDLNGGFADKTFKIPNPNYFIAYGVRGAGLPKGGRRRYAPLID